MDLTVYDIIVGPVLTDKAYTINKNLKKLVLRVHPKANKPLIKEALEKLFNVKVDSVRVIVSKGKLRRVGKFETCGSLRKKAIVTLKEGHSLDLLDQAGMTKVAGEQVRGPEDKTKRK
ncbi:50S ribosomal protein L23 [Candidatus Dependentiae bacterium HGW-Dependentiae-1]|nr:MAG: 50S ribosomal protein L23 [Candidatus Dependentiae bacterium HGW-Dependentiae-1]